MAESASLIREHLRTQRFVHIAMVIGSVIYGIVILMIDKSSPIDPVIKDTETLNTIKYALVPYIAFMIIAAKFLRTKLLGSDSIFIKKEMDKKPDNDSDKPPFLANYLSSLFVVWAVIEMITIAGLILFMLSGELMLPLAIISLGVFIKIINGPNFEELSKLSTKYDSILMQGV